MDKTTNFLHRLPADMSELLKANKNLDVQKVWDTLTPLARNEWICWVTIVKKKETREEHLRRFCEDIRRGKRRPCCWPGCPHRKPDNKKWFTTRK